MGGGGEGVKGVGGGARFLAGGGGGGGEVVRGGGGWGEVVCKYRRDKIHKDAPAGIGGLSTIELGFRASSL